MTQCDGPATTGISPVGTTGGRPKKCEVNILEDFKETVNYLAKLAHLDLDSEERERMAGQLSAILEAAEKVRELNTEGIRPTSHVIDMKGVFREDEVKESLPLSEVLKNTPYNEEEFFKVPKMTDN